MGLCATSSAQKGSSRASWDLDRGTGASSGAIPPWNPLSCSKVRVELAIFTNSLGVKMRAGLDGLWDKELPFYQGRGVAAHVLQVCMALQPEKSVMESTKIEISHG